MNVVVRPMVEGDVDSVMQIAGSLAEAPHWGRDAYLAAITEGAAPRRVALVAVGQEKLVGFAIASLVAGEAELESIAVDSAAQGAGIGTRLLRDLIAAVARAGCSAVVLEGRASNVAALGLYVRAGFAEVGRRRAYYSGPAEDAVLMRLEIDIRDGFGLSYPQK